MSKKGLALLLHVNFLFYCLLFKAFAGIACHGLPHSACTENNGVPVWRVRVVKGERNGWVGMGPTLLPPETSGWDPGFRFRFKEVRGGMGQSGCQTVGLWVTGLKESSRPHAGKVRSQKTHHFHFAALQYPPHPSRKARYQLAAANLLTHTHVIHQHQHFNRAPVPRNLQQTTTVLGFGL